MEELMNKKLLEEFFQKQIEIQSVNASLKEIEYLENLTEEMIIDNYATHWSKSFT
jgi:hypothetical protein